ncbi:hypothetical protein LSCM1_02351 [Leishmania martiniquensis]|uniref:Transmembrane protein n=1 Tax=Leishmania martiniquensis TaxID=1580590 RepID=A0A836H042_9TRYP|nr:hypothetical protein LSCM1_02351 [Leishmania martiniquensis]
MDDLHTPLSTAFADSVYYLGGVRDSLGHLPPWYQLLSLGGVFCVIHLRNNAVVTWLVVQLHSSIGTEAMWPDEYKDTLRAMSFTERLCFTLYGTALAAVAVVFFRVFCQDTWNIGGNVCQLFPDKKLPTIAMVILMCAAECIRLQQVIAQQFNTPGSLARFAMHGFEEIEATEFDPRVAESNAHFLIQFELLRAYLTQACVHRVPAVLLAGVYRLFRDVPNKAHVALRWYMATIAGFTVVQELLGMYIQYVWTDWSLWAMVIWALVFIGVVNFVYGLSKRAGTVVTMSSANSVTEALRGLLTCSVLWFIASLVVLAFVVSVHEELVLIWLFMSLMILWTPAIIDACAIDYMAFLSIGAGGVVYAMGGGVSVWTSVRFGALHFLWWLFVSLLYNAALHVFASRYIAMTVAAAWFLWSLAPPTELWENAESAAELGLEDGHGIVHLLTARVLWLRAVAEFRSLPKDSWIYARTQGDGRQAFDFLLHAAVSGSAACVAISSLAERRFTDEARLVWQQRDIVSATPGVLLRKMIRTLVIVGCVAISASMWWVVRHYVLPLWTQLLPDIINKSLATVTAVTVLGNLMDMQDGLYTAFMRILGLRDVLRAREGQAHASDDDPNAPAEKLSPEDNDDTYEETFE